MQNSDWSESSQSDRAFANTAQLRSERSRTRATTRVAAREPVGEARTVGLREEWRRLGNGSKLKIPAGPDVHESLQGFGEACVIAGEGGNVEIGVRDGELEEIHDNFGGKKRGVLLRILPRGVAQQRVHIAEERVPPLLLGLHETPLRRAR